jgi:diaminohydroxyphosphoribosylaminopyrimidine deaminase/5-amino-6-(5-phosphoribosylamino)uracil reductase
MSDPYEKVAGQGFEALRKAGCKVESGKMEDAARRQNAGFISRKERGRPFVRVKLAASLDGCSAMASGESQWITGAPARQDVQRLRAASGAIMTGCDTIIADNPALTVRDRSLVSRQPLRAIVDSHLRTPADARMFTLEGNTVIYCIDDRNRAALEGAGASIELVPAREERTDLPTVLARLADLGVNDVLVEGGPVLAGAMLDQELVDELVIYQASHIMGSETRTMLATPKWQSLDDKQALDVIDRRQIGQDVRITAVPRPRSA